MPSWPLFSLILFLISSVLAFEAPIADTDYSRQVCSGMWGGPSAYINVTFDTTSQPADMAMLIYEWKDVKYFGKETTPETDDDLPKTYMCTSNALSAGYCDRAQLGHFILDLPASVSIKDTSFWEARVQLPGNSTSGGRTPVAASGFWDNPEGNPTPPTSPYNSPWRRRSLKNSVVARQATEVNSDHILVYNQPIHYPVRKTGYYCVAVVPFTIESSARAVTDVPNHPSYRGTVLFKNTFDGQLPATDYPKVTFYFIMFVTYSFFAVLWGWFCFRHIHELLPIQYYLSGLVGLLVIEMFANWVYYRYLNAHGRSTASTVFLIVVAILDAGRNSMSFFMLLVVSLGLSVVKESLGRTMLKCQALAVAHFIFGILYAIGIVELELESTKALTLLLFIIPLAFSLSAFLLWIMYSLNATIAYLRAKKQKYKLKMFERLYYILIFTVFVIAIFFVVSSLSFSGRLAEDYAAKTWRVRWWLLDGWLALLYLTAFALIAFLWRPNEIAQDEQDAEDYDLETLHSRHHGQDDDDDDAATLVGGRRGNPNAPTGGEDVVFEIGDEDDDEDEASKKAKAIRLSGENGRGDEELQGLMR